MLNIQSRPCCGKQDVVLHPSRAVVLSRPTVRGCSLLQQNQQVQRPSWVVGAGQNGFPWDVLGGAKKMRGHPWNGEELSHAQVLQRQAEGSKAQAAEAGTEADATIANAHSALDRSSTLPPSAASTITTATAHATQAAASASLPTTAQPPSYPQSSGSSSPEAPLTSSKDSAHAVAAAPRPAGGEPEVLVSKSLLDSLTSNLKSIQLARSSWAVRMQELQADMAQRIRAHEATERQLREVQLEKRGMALKLQQTEDALVQLQELQQQQLQLLTSLQGLEREREQQLQLQALSAEGWLDPQNATAAVPPLPEASPLSRASSPSPSVVPQAVPVATTPVTLSIRKETRPGENVYVVGNQQFCGNWVPKDALKLKWTDGHVWRRTCDVPQGVEVCFKMVEVKDTGDANWESGSDRNFTVAPGTAHGLDVVCEW
eukprot:CAMPEP_0202345398 /NCGR_PEP_ID=MMETSP1126-20121109/4659_1 /ASSEMBLY_ACC=CAM_ASM_000457 /TAXON_ID=3047 /ORGANISM="Dunaliella tertiolecta, Strain CCMP1320" /LENGTH=429 /DNA_ID=CAMNT_0048936707 /DNA_START=1459 /DNA_END=2745 /DNA_ORIENTATION=+